MLLKRILIGVLCAVIVGGAIYSGTQYQFFDKPLSEKEQVSFEEKIDLPDGFLLAASVDAFGNIRNSMESVKSGVEGSSFALELHVAFDENGTPFLADGRDYITDKSVKLETIFKNYAKQKYLHFILRLEKAINDQELYQLALQYDCADRIMVSGISRQDMAEYMDQLTSFPVIVDLDSDVKNLNKSDVCNELITEYAGMGAHMILAPLDQVTDSLVEYTSAYGQFALAISDVSSEYDMYKALSLRPSLIITDNPDMLFEIMRSGDHMGFLQ